MHTLDVTRQFINRANWDWQPPRRQRNIHRTRWTVYISTNDFGLAITPSMFKWSMDIIQSTVKRKFGFSYMRDFFIFWRSVKCHQDHIQRVVHFCSGASIACPLKWKVLFLWGLHWLLRKLNAACQTKDFGECYRCYLQTTASNKPDWAHIISRYSQHIPTVSTKLWEQSPRTELTVGKEQAVPVWTMAWDLNRGAGKAT